MRRKKDKSIKPRNNKGEPHGYWEGYWSNGDLRFKCLFHNSKHVGYDEIYFNKYGNGNGKLTRKRYNI